MPADSLQHGTTTRNVMIAYKYIERILQKKKFLRLTGGSGLNRAKEPRSALLLFAGAASLRPKTGPLEKEKLLPK